MSSMLRGGQASGKTQAAGRATVAPHTGRACTCNVHTDTRTHTQLAGHATQPKNATAAHSDFKSFRKYSCSEKPELSKPHVLIPMYFWGNFDVLNHWGRHQ